MNPTTSQQIAKLVQQSLAFHNLNRSVETELGLSMIQYHLLSLLKDRPGASPQALAKAVGMHASTLTQSLKRLSRKEFLFVSEDPRDFRKKMITLTFEGKQVLDRFENGIEELLQKRSEKSSIEHILADTWACDPRRQSK